MKVKLTTIIESYFSLVELSRKEFEMATALKIARVYKVATDHFKLHEDTRIKRLKELGGVLNPKTQQFEALDPATNEYKKLSSDVLDNLDKEMKAAGEEEIEIPGEKLSPDLFNGHKFNSRMLADLEWLIA